MPRSRQSAPCRLARLGLIHGLLACQIPCWQGKKQGISTIRPIFARIRLENSCKFNVLRENSLRIEQGIYLREQGIILWSREFGAKPIRASRRIKGVADRK
jgi:hypothetical protein